MLSQTLKPAFILLVSLCCSISFASPSENSVEDLINLSGIAKQIMELPEFVKVGVEQGDPLPESDLALILKSADKSISPSIVLNEITKSVHLVLNDEEVEQLLEWYESGLGRKITQAEEKAFTLEASQEVVKEAEQLMEDKKRLEAAKRIDALVGSTDSVVDIQQFARIAVGFAVMTAKKTDEKPDLEKLKAQLVEREPDMTENVQQMVALTLAYAYQSIKEDDLAKYEAFLKTPAMQKFKDAVMKGMNSGLDKVTADWKSTIATDLK